MTTVAIPPSLIERFRPHADINIASVLTLVHSVWWLAVTVFVGAAMPHPS